jgi:hypothetical protein
MGRIGSAAACLLLGFSLRATAQTAPSVDQVIARFADYMRTYAREYAATIAEEHYTQFAAGRMVVLDSEFGIVALPGGAQWLGLRDVIRVAGKPVPDRDTRLVQLFAASARPGFRESIERQSSQIVAESARFNIGTIQRTINNPALVLELLDPRHHAGFKFSKAGETVITGVRAWRLGFVERGRPTVISTTRDEDLPASGEILVDPESGRLFRADVLVRLFVPRSTGGAMEGRVSVTFTYVPELQLWLPNRMTERYDQGTGRQLQSGEATYTHYRRFRVESQENITTSKATPEK